jgi:hypothetical protein
VDTILFFVVLSKVRELHRERNQKEGKDK